MTSDSRYVSAGPENATQSATAYERLRQDILSCRLEPGKKLTINVLCADLELSLGAVREALSRLLSEDLVIAEPQRGYRVTPVSAAELTDLTKARVHIETACFVRSIQVGDLQWEGRIVAAFHQLSRTPERTTKEPKVLSDAWVQVHSQFHNSLVSACDSQWLLRIREMLFSRWERYIRLSVPLARVDRDTNVDHQQLMDVAMSRNKKEASRLLSTHIERTTQILLDSNVDFDSAL